MSVSSYTGLSSKGYIVRDRAFDVVSVQGTLKADSICSTSSSGKISFKAGASYTTCMTIDSSGRIGFNQSAPTSAVQFSSATPAVANSNVIVFDDLPDAGAAGFNLGDLATGQLYADAGALKVKV